MRTTLRRSIAALIAAAALAGATLPAQAAFPGQPNTIVFWSHRDGSYEMFRMAANGADQTKIGTGFATAYPGQLSPTGDRVVFVSQAGSGQEVWVSDLDGSNAMQLTTSANSIYDPSWHPGGTKVIYSAYVAALNSLELFTIRADGSGTPTRVARTPRIIEYSPAYSPDGKWIAVAASPSDDYASYDLYLISADGSTVKRLTRTPTRQESAPDWRKDGARIALGVYREAADDADVWTCKPDGTGWRNLTKTAGLDEGFPVWLANGRIVFEARPDGEDSEVYSMLADGTGVVNLTDNDADDGTGEVS